MDIPRTRGTGCCIRARGGTGTSAEHSRDAGHQGIVDLLWADEMNVPIDTSCGRNLAFPSDHFRTGADHDVDIGLYVWIASFTDDRDPSVFDPDVRLDDAPMINY